MNLFQVRYLAHFESQTILQSYSQCPWWKLQRIVLPKASSTYIASLEMSAHSFFFSLPSFQFSSFFLPIFFKQLFYLVFLLFLFSFLFCQISRTNVSLHSISLENVYSQLHSFFRLYYELIGDGPQKILFIMGRMQSNIKSNYNKRSWCHL